MTSIIVSFFSFEIVVLRGLANILLPGRLQFLDATLDGMIQRFEDEYPETRMPGNSTSVAPPVVDTSSQHSSHDEVASEPHTPENGVDDSENLDEAVGVDIVHDGEEAGQYSIRLSRASSNTSLHSRALTTEEGRVHRFGQNVRREILGPEFSATEDATAPTFEDTNVSAADDRLDRLRSDEIHSRIALVGVDKALGELDSSVEELWFLQKQDPEAFERLRESQIAAQINAGLSVQPSPTTANAEAHDKENKESRAEDAAQ